MVRLHVKKADESQFLYETTVEIGSDDLIDDITKVYNARLKTHRICAGKLFFFLYIIGFNWRLAQVQ